MVRELTHWADLTLQVDGLESGYSQDIQGRVCFRHKPAPLLPVISKSAPAAERLLFKISETNVQFFAPGSRLGGI